MTASRPIQDDRTMTSETAATEAPFQLDPASGRPLHGIVSLPDAAGRQPVVVISHGFKGFMEWGFFPHLAELLRSRGFTVVRFNFWGTGMQPGDELVTDTAAFRANTYAREQEDLLAILAALGTTIAPGRVDPDRIGLLGHSRGGGASILAAAHPEWSERVRALVTWNSIGRIDYVGESQRARWREQGELEVVNGRTGQRLMLGPELLAEVENPPAALDIPAAAARRTAPWLILHGENDEAVPLAEGRALAAAAGGVHEWHAVADGSHTFGARHPFAGPTPHLIEALNATQGWFRRHLAQPSPATAASASA
jgi:dipeptidyl aminopeptidase/acylaminoacyl peptidase